jgi:hypothetical protein
MRSVKEIKNQLVRNSLARGHANYLGAGSTIDGLADDIAILASEIESRQEFILGNIHPSTASSDQVNFMARSFNVSRNLPEKAYTHAGEKNLIVSTKDGQPIINALAQNNILLEGLIVTNSNGSIRYLIQSTLGQPITSSSSVYVSAIALETGTAYNVSSNTLTKFQRSFSNLTVTNNFPINTGYDGDNDETLKLKILGKIESNQENLNTIDSILQEVPNIGKHYIESEELGIGSLTIYLQPSDGVAFPANMLQEISRKIKERIRIGNRLIVKNFNLVTVSIKTRILTNSNIISSENAKLETERVIVEYFNRLQGGGNVNLSAIENLVKTIPGIKLISRTGSFTEAKVRTYEGNTYFENVMAPGSVVSLNQDQIATLGQLDITYE